MFKFSNILLGFIFTVFSTYAHAEVKLELKSGNKISAGQTVVSFDLIDSSTGAHLSANDLSISHEKKLHFIAYDPGLMEFQHVHPDFDGTSWNVDMNFAVNGDYFVWAQGELASDSSDFNANTRLLVENGTPEWPTPNLSDVRSGSLTGSVATLSNQKIKAGKMAMLMLTFTEADGSPANISPYLGAFAHVISTPTDGSSLLHVHPMDGSTPNEGMLHATFPNPGFYRIWVQFIDGGVLKTIPLSVAVTK